MSDFHAEGGHRGTSTTIENPFVQLCGLSLLEVDDLWWQLYEICGLKIDWLAGPIKGIPQSDLGRSELLSKLWSPGKGRSFKSNLVVSSKGQQRPVQASGGPEGLRNLAGERLSPFLLYWMNKNWYFTMALRSDMYSRLTYEPLARGI